MELDHQICSRARLARDARFDGKFFIGVLTTRIYCRPICRARTSRNAMFATFSVQLQLLKPVFARACDAVRSARQELPHG